MKANDPPYRPRPQTQMSSLTWRTATLLLLALMQHGSQPFMVPAQLAVRRGLNTMQMAQALSRGLGMVKDGKSFQKSKAGGPQSCGGNRGPKHLPHYSALESLGSKQGKQGHGPVDQAQNSRPSVPDSTRPTQWLGEFWEPGGGVSKYPWRS